MTESFQDWIKHRVSLEAVQVGDQLVLVVGSRLVVLNGSGAEAWRSMRPGPVRTVCGTAAHLFMERLASLGLVCRSDRPGAAALGPGDTPEVAYEGEVELIAYGTTGGPIEGKPVLGPPLPPPDRRDPEDKD